MSPNLRNRSWLKVLAKPVCFSNEGNAPCCSLILVLSFAKTPLIIEVGKEMSDSMENAPPETLDFLSPI